MLYGETTVFVSYCVFIYFGNINVKNAILASAPCKPRNRLFCCCALAYAPCSFLKFFFCLFLKFAPLSSQTLTFADAKIGASLVFCFSRLLAVSRSYHKIIKNIICLEHFLANMELSLKRRASDVHRLIAGAVNPSSSTAMGPLGAHLDPR